jgi:hypothetical protein
VGEGKGTRGEYVSLPALAGADENSPRFDLESVMRLLCGKAEVERRIGGRPSGLREEGWRWRDGGGLYGGKVERVGVCKVGRLGGVVVDRGTERRRELPGGTVPRRLLSLWRARLALDWGRRIQEIFDRLFVRHLIVYIAAAHCIGSCILASKAGGILPFPVKRCGC